MKDAQNVNLLVWKILSQDLAVQKCLQSNIINARALARLIIQSRKLSVSLDAVISAIRRFEKTEVFEEDDKLLGILKNSKVSTRTNVCCITVTMSARELFQKLVLMDIKTCLSLGQDECKVVVEGLHVKSFLSQVGKSVITNIDDDLAEMSVVIDKKGLQTKGVLARIASEVALANINIQEIIVCPPEFLIYVKEKDMVKAHEALLKLCR